MRDICVGDKVIHIDDVFDRGRVVSTSYPYAEVEFYIGTQLTYRIFNWNKLIVL